ncbi:MAG: tRNA(Ile)-lysidine synthetase [uncultured bacterium (gcode 4)]|uniref:tRNA(Ile)-lysidine synthase n=1 Tax=uncultured bacterium (gcode 4) TaxID=1234023 RepID=K2FY43_9BACT|nr:MAG: tRNA(Ile)-lysidine synthetase [uncultured bacterium (gcode 4)]
MIKDFFNKHWIIKKNIIVAFSWWSDSVYLLKEILKFKEKDTIIVWHFNHNLRNEESKRDEKFVIDFCKKNNLKCEIWEADIKKISEKKKIWIEEAARIERYVFLRWLKEKYQASYILTAHHIDDKVETFILNLIRWSKLKWLISIEEKNNDLLRPILNVNKNEILENLKNEKIDYMNDSSNLDDSYLRNHIRLNIAPNFWKINPQYQKTLNSLMWYFWELKWFLDDMIESEVKTIENDSDNKENDLFKNFIEIDSFQNKSGFIKKELVRYIFEMTNNWTIWLTKSNIDEVIRFIWDRWNYTKKDIKNMKLFKKNWKIYF